VTNYSREISGFNDFIEKKIELVDIPMVVENIHGTNQMG